MTTRVRSITVEQARAELRAAIREYERRYETTSIEMAERIETDSRWDTAEIIRWMIDCHTLRSLETIR